MRTPALFTNPIRGTMIVLAIVFLLATLATIPMFIRMFKLVQKHSDSRLDAITFIVVVTLMQLSFLCKELAEIQRLLQ